MKILENNLKDEIQLTCHGCGSVLLVKKDDFKHDSEILVYYTCPVCNDTNFESLDILRQNGLFI